MAKTKVVRKKPRKVAGRRSAVRSNEDALDSYAAMHARMLYDPCGADLVESVYTGDRGYINRFKSDFTIGGSAGSTAVALFIFPGSGLMGNIETGNPATSQVFTLTNSGVPGTGFLVGNASKMRAVGSCAVITPVSSPNNATGVINYGIVPASCITSGISYPINNLLTLCTQRVSLANACTNPLEIKWSPGGYDDKYSPLFNSDDPTDRNGLLIIATGMQAATGLNVRRVDITEWTPLVGLGVAVDSSAVKKSRCDISCVLRNLKRKDPEWWWALGRKTLGGIQQITEAYMSGGLVGAANRVVKFM